MLLPRGEVPQADRVRLGILIPGCQPASITGQGEQSLRRSGRITQGRTPLAACGVPYLNHSGAASRRQDLVVAREEQTANLSFQIEPLLIRQGIANLELVVPAALGEEAALRGQDQKRPRTLFGFLKRKPSQSLPLGNVPDVPASGRVGVRLVNDVDHAPGTIGVQQSAIGGEGQGRNPGFMAFEAGHDFLLLHVPQLDGGGRDEVGIAAANRQQPAIRGIRQGFDAFPADVGSSQAGARGRAKEAEPSLLQGRDGLAIGGECHRSNGPTPGKLGLPTPRNQIPDLSLKLIFLVPDHQTLAVGRDGGFRTEIRVLKGKRPHSRQRPRRQTLPLAVSTWRLGRNNGSGQCLHVPDQSGPIRRRCDQALPIRRETQRPELFPSSLQAKARLARLRFPGSQFSLPVDRCHQTRIRRQGDGLQDEAANVDPTQALAAGRVPQADHVVRPDRGQRASLRREIHRVDGMAPMSRPVFDLPTSSHVPGLKRPVFARGEQGPAIWSKHACLNPRSRKALAPGAALPGQVPEADSAFRFHAARQPAPIRRRRQKCHDAGERRQFALFATRGCVSKRDRVQPFALFDGDQLLAVRGEDEAVNRSLVRRLPGNSTCSSVSNGQHAIIVEDGQSPAIR